MNIRDSQPKGQVRSTRAKDRDGKGFSYSVPNETTSSDEWLIATKEKIMTTIARLKTLRRAYEIENEMMMDHWKKDVEEHFSEPGIQSSFQSTWESYLEAVCESNDVIMKICDKGIDGTITPEKATKEIVDEQHEYQKMKKFWHANGEKKKAPLKDYLSAVREVLGLEVTVAKNIENYLNTGTP